MTAKRYFALRKGNREVAVFSGRSPRQAALKAATRGISDIQLRERGTKKVHVFRGSRKKVKTPSNRPSWMAAEVFKPNVKKLKINRLKKL